MYAKEQVQMQHISTKCNMSVPILPLMVCMYLIVTQLVLLFMLKGVKTITWISKTNPEIWRNGAVRFHIKSKS